METEIRNKMDKGGQLEYGIFSKNCKNSRRRINLTNKLNINGFEETRKDRIIKHLDEHFKKLINIKQEHPISLKEEILGSSPINIIWKIIS